MGIIQFMKSKTFLKQLGIAFIGLAVFIFILTKWLNISTNHDQKIEVPNFEKMSIQQVEKIIDELNLNFEVIDSASFNPDFPLKSVITQSPDAGDFVKEKRKIYLTLNPSGFANVEIPDFYGKTKRQATSQLLSIGFQVSTTEIIVPDIAKDVVRGLFFNGKELKPGDKIPQNSIITLKLGDGNGAGSSQNSGETANDINEETGF